MKAATDWEFGNSEGPIYLTVADHRILLRSLIDEISIRHPLGLYEFELLLQVCADQEENAAALRAVIFQDAFRQRRTIVRTAAEEVVKIDGYEIILQGITGARAPNVRTERTL